MPINERQILKKPQVKMPDTIEPGGMVWTAITELGGWIVDWLPDNLFGSQKPQKPSMPHTPRSSHKPTKLH